MQPPGGFSKAPFQQVLDSLNWWVAHAPPQIVLLLQKGVEYDFPCPQLPIRPCQRSAKDVQLATKVMEEYVQLGAAKEVPWAGTKYLVPWFFIQRTDPLGKEKLRLISDCREINSFLNPPHSNYTNGKTSSLA